ncbi:MAG: beta-N-acetylhexosaminidase [Armatimonadetes bacterium]|nr:beta-N-acetylhexosaminidase [Armatimonadota bacterium]
MFPRKTSALITPLALFAATWSLSVSAPVHAAPPLLIPRPKKITATEGASYVLPASPRIVIAKDATVGEKRAAFLLKNELKVYYGRTATTVTVPRAALAAQKSGIVIGDKTAAPPPPNPEGYTINATASRVALAGRDSAGSYWAAQTLVQLFDKNGAGKTIVHPARIVDYPSLKLRGVHLFYGKDALPFQKKLIDRVFARYKMNALFIQAEQVRWNHDPEVAPAWAGNKADLKTQIAYAKAHGITMYPLVQGYGHMEWLFNKADNKKYAEDPDKPYAVNFSDPAAVKYVEGFITEADDLFHAPAFHVGLDEVHMRGRMPYRSKGKTFPQLYVGAVKHYKTLFAKRGKPIYIWADMGLFPKEVSPDFGTARTPAEAKAVRDGLPRDIYLANWQYGERDVYPSMDLYKKEGFKNLIATTWNRPGNIPGFSKKMVEIGGIGAIQSTWAGYESKESQLSNADWRPQFTAFVLAAEYFWNGGTGPAPEKLPYNWNTVFAKSYAGVSASDAVAYKPGAGAKSVASRKR